MVFFDFLQQQEPPQEIPRKRRPFTGPLGLLQRKDEAAPVLAQETPQEPPAPVEAPKVEIPEHEQALIKRRAKLIDEIRKGAEKFIDTGIVDPPARARIRARVYGAGDKPQEVIAPKDILERVISPWYDRAKADLGPSFEALKGVIRDLEEKTIELRLLEESPTFVEQQARLQKPITEARKTAAETAAQALEPIAEQARVAPPGELREELEARQKTLQAQVRKAGIPGAQPPPPVVPPPTVTGAPPGIEKPEPKIAEVLKGGGADAITALNEGIDILEKFFGRSLDLDERVPFDTALGTAWGQIDPEGFEKFGQRYSAALRPPQVAQPTETQKKLMAPPTPGEEETREIRRLFQELKATRDFDNWISVIAFILVSMVAGPGLALMLFSKKQKRGELKLELEELREQREAKLKAAQREEDYARDLRKMVAQSRVTEAREKRMKAMDFVLDLYSNMQRLRGKISREPALTEEEELERKELQSAVDRFGKLAMKAKDAASELDMAMSAEERKKYAGDFRYFYDKAKEASDELEYVFEQRRKMRQAAKR